MRIPFVLIFLSLQSLAQSNVHIKGQFEGFPSSNYTVLVQNTGALNPFFTYFNKGQKEEELSRTDENGCFQTDLRLESTQKVTVACLGYHLDFLLSPNDTLIFRNLSRNSSPIVEGSTACLHQLLYESLLFGRDTLREKPLFQHISVEDYAHIINDLSAHQWERFQQDCDTTNLFINTYIKASLEGQKFLRKQIYTSSQGSISETKKSHLNILGDDARVSETYLEALYTDLVGAPPITRIKGNFVVLDSTFWERGYSRVLEALAKVPHTRELLLARIVQRSSLNMTISADGGRMIIHQSLFERFKKDFPQSPYIETLQASINEGFRFMQNLPKPAKK